MIYPLFAIYPLLAIFPLFAIDPLYVHGAAGPLAQPVGRGVGGYARGGGQVLLIAPREFPFVRELIDCIQL